MSTGSGVATLQCRSPTFWITTNLSVQEPHRWDRYREHPAGCNKFAESTVVLPPSASAARYATIGLQFSSRSTRRHVWPRGALASGSPSVTCSVSPAREQWRALLTNLEAIDQVVAASAGDLPGRNVRDLLRILAMLRDHGVGLYFVRDDIDTGMGSPPFAVLDIVEAHRRARFSRAIRDGQARCLAAGKVIGRPAIRPSVRIKSKCIWPGALVSGLRRGDSRSVRPAS
jgi:hypothetical protein